MIECTQVKSLSYLQAFPRLLGLRLHLWRTCADWISLSAPPKQAMAPQANHQHHELQRRLQACCVLIVHNNLTISPPFAHTLNLAHLPALCNAVLCTHDSTQSNSCLSAALSLSLTHKPGSACRKRVVFKPPQCFKCNLNDIGMCYLLNGMGTCCSTPGEHKSPSDQFICIIL
jgi:hypothetical protein